MSKNTINKKPINNKHGGYKLENRFYSALYNLVTSIMKNQVCNIKTLTTDASFISQYNSIYKIFINTPFSELSSRFNCVISKLYNYWDSYTLLSFLGVLYLSQYNEVEDNVSLKNNSANCDFAIFKINNNKRKFIKFVSYPWTGDDDIIINDCIHGRLLNKILLQYPKYTQHFMTFNESFLTFIQKNPNNWAIKNIMILSDNYPKIPTAQKKYAAVFDIINGHSLSDLHSNIYSNKAYDYIFYVDFPKFYDAFEELGLKHGLIHNDLHLGNIYFNTDTQHLMLIDYGRMVLGSKLYQQSDANMILRSEMMRLNMQTLKTSDYAAKLLNNKTITYKEFIKATNNYLHSDVQTSYDKGVYYPMHIMDMITLCANLYITNMQRKDKKDIYMNFLTISGNINNRESIKFTLYKSTDVLFGLYLQSYDKILDNLSKWRHESSLIILEGMMYFAMFLLFIKDNGDDNKPQTRDKFTFDMEDIEDYFWLYFQYTGSQNDAKRFLKYLFNSVAKYKKSDYLIESTRILKKLNDLKKSRKIQIITGAGTMSNDQQPQLDSSDKISNEELDSAFVKNRDKKFRAPVKRANIIISDEPYESNLACSRSQDDITILKPFLELYGGSYHDKTHKKTGKRQEKN